jgi:hypothetical protein
MIYGHIRIFGAIAAFLITGVGSPSSAAEIAIIATKNDCRRLVAHEPDGDVAFKPGVDARGRPVVPAGLPSSQSVLSDLPKAYAFPISVNPLSEDAGQRFSETRLDLGKIRFDPGTGDVSYNGRHLRGPQKQTFVLECKKILGM